MSQPAKTYKADPQLGARLLTSVLLAPAAISAVLFLPTRYFALLFGVVLILGVWEWTRIIGVERKRFRASLVLLNATLIGLCWYFLLRHQWLYVAEVGVLWWFVSVFWLRRFEFAQAQTAKNLELKTIVGSLLVIPAWCAAVLIHSDPDRGPHWTLFVMGLVWVADIGAYFSGRRFGNKKLAPNISPGKTREGVYGALALSAIYSFVVTQWLFNKVPTEAMLYVLIGFFVVVFSIVGDLFESLMKRHAAMKDSGSLLPGHGGVLDRIDSLLAALPVFVFARWILGI
jgi:phosphatidate cytidylyltransferase